jgi:hypothetical protein
MESLLYFDTGRCRALQHNVNNIEHRNKFVNKFVLYPIVDVG